jgi:predicted MFS family arabinose efflux permease
MGVKQAGVQIGAFVIGLLLAPAASAFGWRGALLALAVIPVAVLGAVVGAIPADDPVHTEVDSDPPRGQLSPGVWWMMAYASFMGAGVAGVSAYLPLFAHERLGLSTERAGIVVGVIGLIGILSRVTLGWISERIGRFAVSLAFMSAGSVIAAFMLLIARVDATWLLWAAGVVFGVSAITWNTVGMIAVLAEVDSRDAGRASGYVQSGFYGGFALSPVLFGYSVDHTGGYTQGWLGVTIAFFLATLVAVAWHRTRGRAPTPASA